MIASVLKTVLPETETSPKRCTVPSFTGMMIFTFGRLPWRICTICGSPKLTAVYP